MHGQKNIKKKIVHGWKIKVGSTIKPILFPSLLVRKQMIYVTIFILSDNVFVTFYWIVKKLGMSVVIVFTIVEMKPILVFVYVLSNLFFFQNDRVF